ncbi:MAG: urate hydroxylase PuuD, partial [Simkania sp.]|nr:urate hydroxylase PuuD [Simkania sp.]
NRSTHNHYFTLPLIFIMMSNHFPGTYGHRYNWVFLILIGLVGSAIRYAYNLREKSVKKMFFFLFCALVGLAILFEMTMVHEKAHNHSSTEVHSSGNPDNPNDPDDPQDETGDPQENGTDETNEKATEEPEDPNLIAIVPEKTGTIKGIVLFDGEAPKPKKIKVLRSCTVNSNEPVFEEKLLVREGKLQNVIVSVGKGLEGYRIPKPKKRLVIDQRGCVFRPHVSTAQINQRVRIKNSDELLHNVHAYHENGQEIFNRSMPLKGQKIDWKFDESEVILFQCDAHPWMISYLGVFAHPFYSISSDLGAFEIQGVPAGEYTLEAWHQEFGRQTLTVKVEAQKTTEAKFTFKAK